MNKRQKKKRGKKIEIAIEKMLNSQDLGKIGDALSLMIEEGIVDNYIPNPNK